MADELSPLAAALRAAWVRSNGDSVELWNDVATAAREHLSAAKPAAPAARPTCATCPHWEADASANGGGWGECLHAPRRHRKHNGDRCSHHPDFPAWIAARAEGGR